MVRAGQRGKVGASGHFATTLIHASIAARSWAEPRADRPAPWSCAAPDASVAKPRQARSVDRAARPDPWSGCATCGRGQRQQTWSAISSCRDLASVSQGRHLCGGQGRDSLFGRHGGDLGRGQHHQLITASMAGAWIRGQHTHLRRGQTADLAAVVRAAISCVSISTRASGGDLAASCEELRAAACASDPMCHQIIGFQPRDQRRSADRGDLPRGHMPPPDLWSVLRPGLR